MRPSEISHFQRSDFCAADFSAACALCFLNNVNMHSLGKIQVQNIVNSVVNDNALNKFNSLQYHS